MKSFPTKIELDDSSCSYMKSTGSKFYQPTESSKRKMTQKSQIR